MKQQLALTAVVALLSVVDRLPAQTKSPTTGTSATGAPATGSPATMRSDKFPGYVLHQIEGFTCVVSDETLQHQATDEFERKPLDVLDMELKTIVKLMKPEAVRVLRGLLIWVEWDEKLAMANGRQGSALAVYYGGHQTQLLNEGKHPLKAKNIAILSMKGLTQEHQPKRDSGRCVILHEMTHAVHDQFLGFENPMVQAGYRQAMERKLYDPTMYAATNEHEYFAELTCAYFDQLHYYPNTRGDLKKHDPLTFEMMESIWGKRQDATGPTKQTNDPVIALKLEEVDFGNTVQGTTPTATELKGRPVMVVAWNASSPSSMSCFQKVNAWDAELRDFGLATIAVHLNGVGQNEDVKAAALSRNVAFTVCETRWVNGGLIDDFKEFPRCYIFDHQGRCVFKDSPFNAEEKLRSVVDAALLASLGDVEPPKGISSVVEMLRKGKPPATVLTPLAGMTRLKDAEAAAAATTLMTAMTAGAEKRLTEAEGLLTADPVTAFVMVARMPQDFRGTPVSTKATALIAKLKRDKAVIVEFQAMPTLAQVNKLDAELSVRPGAFDPKQPAFRQENGPMLQQLQFAAATLKRTYPTSRSAAEAARIADRYGLMLP